MKITDLKVGDNVKLSKPKGRHGGWEPNGLMDRYNNRNCKIHKVFEDAKYFTIIQDVDDTECKKHNWNPAWDYCWVFSPSDVQKIIKNKKLYKWQSIDTE